MTQKALIYIFESETQKDRGSKTYYGASSISLIFCHRTWPFCNLTTKLNFLYHYFLTHVWTDLKWSHYLCRKRVCRRRHGLHHISSWCNSFLHSLNIRLLSTISRWINTKLYYPLMHFYRSIISSITYSCSPNYWKAESASFQCFNSSLHGIGVIFIKSGPLFQIYYLQMK